MKRIVFILFLIFSTAYAERYKAYPDVEMLKVHLPIVDIRTPAEWRETGIIKGSIPITFYDKYGNYDVKKFLKELNKRVDTSKPFAIICHVGNRSAVVSDFLARQGYTVVDIVGGIVEAKKRGLPIVPYM